MHSSLAHQTLAISSKIRKPGGGDFGKFKLPTKVTGVIDVANDPIIFETKFDWKIGKDIPEELVNQLKSIKASTEK